MDDNKWAGADISAGGASDADASDTSASLRSEADIELRSPLRLSLGENIADVELIFLLVVTGSLITLLTARVRGCSPFMATDIVNAVFLSSSVISPNRTTGKGLVLSVDGGPCADTAV